MKKLIYSTFLLFIILLAASCQKDSSIAKPAAKVKSQDSLVTVSLVNNSNTAYELSFAKINYTVDIPKNGRMSINVKAGAYNITVYPISSSDYSPHSIQWDDLSPVYSPRASFDVQLEASSSQSLLIY
jgi:hypothetical protein